MLITIPKGLNKLILIKGQELYSWGFTYKKVATFLCEEFNLNVKDTHLYATYSRVPNVSQIA